MSRFHESQRRVCGLNINKGETEEEKTINKNSQGKSVPI